MQIIPCRAARLAVHDDLSSMRSEKNCTNNCAQGYILVLSKSTQGWISFSACPPALGIGNNGYFSDKVSVFLSSNNPFRAQTLEIGNGTEGADCWLDCHVVVEYRKRYDKQSEAFQQHVGLDSRENMHVLVGGVGVSLAMNLRTECGALESLAHVYVGSIGSLSFSLQNLLCRLSVEWCPLLCHGLMVI